MSLVKRHKTKYPGVSYVVGTSAADGKPERIYYIRYRKNGKAVEEPVGRQFRDDMTPAKANTIKGNRINGNELSNRGKRAQQKAAKDALAEKWTIDRLWNEYSSQRKAGKGLIVDTNRYEVYLKDKFGDKEPHEIIALDTDRLRLKLLKSKSPQTVAHILNLLTWIINFGVYKGLSQGVSFKIQKPTVDNRKTEDLNQDELNRLLAAIAKDENQDIANMMRMVLYTGMRRGELFNLKWEDIDFDRGFLTIRDPKGGSSQKIPLSDAAKRVLETQKKTQSPHVFPGLDGGKRVSAAKGSCRIRKNAGLSPTFRPFHGLRHVYASMLASSGKVDMYTLQKLLTHKSPLMTQRYAHLRDETLKRASDLAGDIINEAITTAK